ncbi:hypothetical protein, partial [Rhizobium esperanzae]|uniref:hypothetical protein n=1 Tax=Rhizobium esperanzae TaxID=1967781 RepID=UPI001AEEAF97
MLQPISGEWIIQIEIPVRRGLPLTLTVSPLAAGLSHMSDDRDEELIIPPSLLDLATNRGLIW